MIADVVVLKVLHVHASLSGFLLRAADGNAGFEPVIASDAYEACREMERRHPGALLASIDGELTDEVTARKLFAHWLSSI